MSLGVAVIVLGFSGIFVRWSEAPGLVSSFYRMSIATGLMALPALRRMLPRSKLSKRAIWIALLGGLLFAADLGFWASGVMLRGATNPTLLANTAPLWVGLGALVIFRERLRVLFWLGLFISMLGSILILGLDALEGMSFGIGSLMGLFAGLFYGGYILVTQKGRENLDALSYFWISATSSSLILLVATWLFGQPLTGYPPSSYLNFLALGVISQTIGYLAINYALGQIPASIVSPTLLGQPVLTAILAVPLLGEHLNSWQVIGGLAVLLGIILVHRSRRSVEDEKTS
jgi:drug/metabolite transporter (DMT)-like permease